MPTVLITGANRGIGLALAQAYAADGYTVIATARAPETAEALKATGAEVLPLDVSETASIDALAERLGDRPIDLLINNAGVGDRAGVDTVDFETFEHLLAVNTLAPIQILRALRGNLAAGTSPVAANLSSQLGSIENCVGDMGIAYRTSKAALNMALRSAAASFARDGITLLALHPGWVATDMGGAQAPVTPEQSAAGLKTVIGDARPSDTLRFLDWQGETLPW